MDRSGWLPKSRFYLINGNMVGDIIAFATQITAQWQASWLPGSTLVIDESVYEYLGETPCHVYSLIL